MHVISDRVFNSEVGTSIYSGQMLIYEPPGELKTVSENITLGFFTRIKAGVIMQLTDDLIVSVIWMNAWSHITLRLLRGVIRSALDFSVIFCSLQQMSLCFRMFVRVCTYVCVRMRVYVFACVCAYVLFYVCVYVYNYVQYHINMFVYITFYSPLMEFHLVSLLATPGVHGCRNEQWWRH